MALQFESIDYFVQYVMEESILLLVRMGAIGQSMNNSTGLQQVRDVNSCTTVHTRS